MIAIPDVAPRTTVKSAFELPNRVREELQHFFQQSVALEGKNAVPLGWNGPDAGVALIERSMQR